MLLFSTSESNTHTPEHHNSPLARLKKNGNSKDVIIKYDEHYSYPSSPSSSESNAAGDYHLDGHEESIKQLRKDYKLVKTNKLKNEGKVKKLDGLILSNRFPSSVISASFKEWIKNINQTRRRNQSASSVGGVEKSINTSLSCKSKRKRKLPTKSPRRTSDIYTSAPHGVVFRVGVLVNEAILDNVSSSSSSGISDSSSTSNISDSSSGSTMNNNQSSGSNSSSSSSCGSSSNNNSNSNSGIDLVGEGVVRKVVKIQETAIREYLMNDRDEMCYNSTRYLRMQKRMKIKIARKRLIKKSFLEEENSDFFEDDSVKFEVEVDDGPSDQNYGKHVSYDYDKHSSSKSSRSRSRKGSDAYYHDVPNSYYYDTYNYIKDEEEYKNSSKRQLSDDSGSKSSDKRLKKQDSAKAKNPVRVKKPLFKPDGTPVIKLSWRDKICKKECASCHTRKTPMWRDSSDGTPYCNACGIRFKKHHTRCKDCLYIPRKEEKGRAKCPKCSKDSIVLVGK